MLKRDDKVVRRVHLKLLWTVVDACAEAFGSGRGAHSQSKAIRQMYRPQVDEQCRPRKSDPTDIAGRVGDYEWRPFVRWGKPGIFGEEMGKCTQRARRGKSWRHIQKDLTCNWRDPGEARLNRESEMAIMYLGLVGKINYHREGPLVWTDFLRRGVT